MITLADFHGPNAAYVLELYERYQRDPASVDAATRAFFAIRGTELSATPRAQNGVADAPHSELRAQWAPANAEFDYDKVAAAVNLAQAIREYGHLGAQLDPLGGEPPGDPTLLMRNHGLKEEDLRQLPASVIGGVVAVTTANAWEAVQMLRQVYSTSTGHDYDHLRAPDEREWLRQMAESEHFRPPTEPINPIALLEQLTQVETFEHFLQRNFPGKTRFSIEGLDMMVPMLDEIIGRAAEAGIYTLWIGMAHRGRLNVLAHNLNKSYEQLLLEFKDPIHNQKLDLRNDLGWTGDVKYHEGARRALPSGDTASGNTYDVTIYMAPNPSHLEHVNPIVVGMARAASTYADQPGTPHVDPFHSLPIVIHGDAAFPGQGIVAETLNLSRLEGYSTGGTIHIIANNQVGFTTDPSDGRSTLYASDLAKGFKIPVIHVNADDPVACLAAARLAVAYRNKFGRDFLIDLIGYRRYGHNEGDEPRFTQPLPYALVDKHPTVRQQWATKLQQQGLILAGGAEVLQQQQIAKLQAALDKVQVTPQSIEPQLEPPPPGAARQVQTAVPSERLLALHHSLTTLPVGFQVNARLERLIKRRQTMLEKPAEKSIDWGMAELLALASIIDEGTPIRLTGEDVKRGTFSHRHATLFDAESGAPYTALQNLPQANCAFEIYNSPLSENAAIGFEYGYNITAPERLVIWEAQYGDFINTAQAIIDEFLVSGRAKWEQTPSLVLLLPHAYEGQGPDHSSARLERFLQLAAETNLRIAYPTTAAQYFHLLRRQALLLETDPLPLIVLTPKSLLRQPISASSLQELCEGRWQPVIDDAEAQGRAGEITRLILCSGKVYTDLMASPLRATTPTVALVRVEQLYPFPLADLHPLLKQYKNAKEIVWLQEEAENNGAWEFAQPLLRELIGSRRKLRYVGRPRRASPAEGSSAWHSVNQAAIVEQAFSR